MKRGGSDRKLSRRDFLRLTIGSTGAAVLVACGAAPGASSSATSAAAGTSAPAATVAATTPAATAAPVASAAATSAAAVTSAAKPTTLTLPQGAAGKLTVIHRTEYFEAVQTKFRDAVTSYAKGKGITLDISTANPEAFGDFMAKMQAAVQAGNPPDLAYHTLSIPQMQSLDLVEDMSALVAELVAKYGDVVPLTAAQNAKIDGKWWAVPFQSNSGAWFGRKDAFDAAGIDPQSLDTFDKRREAALKISDPSKKLWGWGLTINKSGDGHGLIMDVIQAFGGMITDKSGKKVAFNSPETVAAVQWLKETYSSDKYKPMLPPGIESWTDSSNNEAYLAGTIGLTQNAFSIYAKAKKDNNPVLGKTVVMHKPKTKDGKLLEAGASGWLTIFKGSKNIEAAKDVIRNLVDPQTFTPMVQAGGGLFLPAYKNQWTADLQKIDPNFAILKEIVFNPTPYTGTSYPADPSATIDSILAAAIPSQMMANVTSGKMTPEAAVKDAHDKIVQIFEEAGLKQS